MCARIASSSKKGRRGVSKAAFASQVPVDLVFPFGPVQRDTAPMSFGLDGLDKSSVVFPNPQGDTRVLQRLIGRIEIGGRRRPPLCGNAVASPQNGMMKQLSDVAEFAFQLQFAFAVQFAVRPRLVVLRRHETTYPVCRHIAYSAEVWATKRNGEGQKNPRR